MNDNEEKPFVDVNQFIQTHLQEKYIMLDSYYKYQCENCSETFSVKNEYETHQKNFCVGFSQNNNMRYTDIKCSLCKEIFYSKRQFTNHLQSHNLYKDASSCLQSHENPVHLEIKPKQFKCSQCEKSYKHRTNLITHEKSHFQANLIPFICNLCGDQFKSKQQFKVHFEFKHNDERPFPCDQCNKQFKLKQQLQCHLLTHQDYRAFSCDKCDKAFKLKQQLQNHMAIHVDFKPFQCSICGKSFRLKQQLDVHYRVHDKLKPYECLNCGKTFSLKQNLNVHLLKHSENKPFQCEECGKGFITKQNLTVHLKVHKNVK